jgi:nucleotide-binding universal stress UspA family protein
MRKEDTVKVILVPVDFSDVTSAALEVARTLAAGCGAKVYVVHVEELCAEDLKDVRVLNSHRQFLVELARADHKELQQLAQDLRQRGCDADALCVRGYNVDKILDEVRRLGADLIIMGSHGHGRLYDALIGSTCQGILRRAEVPVLIVPARMTERDPQHAAARRTEY